MKTMQMKSNDVEKTMHSPKKKPQITRLLEHHQKQQQESEDAKCCSFTKSEIDGWLRLEWLQQKFGTKDYPINKLDLSEVEKGTLLATTDFRYFPIDDEFEISKLK